MKLVGRQQTIPVSIVNKYKNNPVKWQWQERQQQQQQQADITVTVGSPAALRNYCIYLASVVYDFSENASSACCMKNDKREKEGEQVEDNEKKKVNINEMFRK